MKTIKPQQLFLADVGGEASRTSSWFRLPG